MTPTLMGGVCFGAGLGITLFGIMYMFIHDGMVHRRFPVRHALLCRGHLMSCTYASLLSMSCSAALREGVDFSARRHGSPVSCGL